MRPPLRAPDSYHRRRKWHCTMACGTIVVKLSSNTDRYTFLFFERMLQICTLPLEISASRAKYALLLPGRGTHPFARDILTVCCLTVGHLPRHLQGDATDQMNQGHGLSTRTELGVPCKPVFPDASHQVFAAARKWWGFLVWSCVSGLVADLLSGQKAWQVGPFL